MLVYRGEGLLESSNILFGTPILPPSSARKRRYCSNDNFLSFVDNLLEIFSDNC